MSGSRPREPEKERPNEPPPGEGDSLEDAAKEAVREMEQRDGGAGSGDIG